MSDIQQLNSHERIAHWLDRPGAASDLSSYFRDADPTQGYTGRYFELVGGGGDQPEHANVVTADDLIAVEMLSVTIPPRVAADLLLGSKGSELNALLAQIPAAVSLTDEDAGPHIAEGSATWQVWDLLIAGRKTGMGTAKVSKLLARKRPQLIPVYDGVVKCAVGEPTNWWECLHTLLIDASRDVGTTIEQLRKQGSVPTYVSDLRIVDVAIWMGHEQAHLAQQCNFPPEPLSS